MKSNLLLDKLIGSNSTRRLGLKKEAVSEIIDTYNDIVVDTLLENGSVNLGNGIIIEVVQLLDRVHVLRGVSYKSSRKYKLKLTMEDKIYNKIEDYYDRLLEDIK